MIIKTGINNDDNDNDAGYTVYILMNTISSNSNEYVRANDDDVDLQMILFSVRTPVMMYSGINDDHNGNY